MHTTFSMSFVDNDEAQLRAALPRVERHHDPQADIGVALSADGTSLIAFDAIAGSVIHRTAVSTRLPILSAGDAIVVEEEDAARVVDAATGRLLLRLPLSRTVPEEHVIGADSDNGFLAISVVAGSGATAHSRLIIAHGDDIEEEVEVDRPIGVPSVAGSSVLVPWAYQHLSIFDLDGEERARIRLRTDVIGHALASREGVWFGGESYYRLNESSADDTPTGWHPPTLPVDRAPTLMPNAYEPPAALSSAAHHVRLHATPDRTRQDGRPADGIFYLAYYRFVFALDADTGAPRWVRSLGADAVGGAAFPGGVRVVAESGEVLTLDAQTGRALAVVNLGEPVSHAVFSRLANVTIAEYVEGPRPDVRMQLLEAVQLPDARLVSGRDFALSRLALLEDDDATADLGLLCEDERLPARTKQRACELLASRPVGSEHVRAQLERHGSFLDERPHPPVAALARAAGTMHDVASLPLLLAQLNDPRTPPAAITAIANAFVEIGDASVVPRLRDFLVLNHTDDSEPGLLDAVSAVANAFARLGGDAAMTELESMAGDAMTPAALSRALRDPVFRIRTERASARGDAARAAAAGGTTPAAPEVPEATPPAHLTHDLANPVLDAHRAELAACLDADPSRPGSARVIVIVRRSGAVADVHTTPRTVAPCLRARMQGLRFPETRGPGATVRLTFTLTP